MQCKNILGQIDTQGDNAHDFSPPDGLDENGTFHLGTLDADCGNFNAPSGRGSHFHSLGSLRMCMATHFWDGKKGYSVAFVFSAPGRMEGDSGRPVTGDTGSNMDKILQQLNLLDPKIFPSYNRYDYLITNASPRVLYAKKDNGRTEEKIKNINNPKNIERVLSEINDCSIVVLCGKRAQKLQQHIKGKKIVTCCHFGNKGLRNHYPNRHEEMKGLESVKRDPKRWLLCAESIHKSLKSHSTGAR